MTKLIVTGIGTDVGKTVAAAVLATCLDGDYWKPIQCGEESSSDCEVMKTLLDQSKHRVYSPVYSFQAPLSPHHASRLENIVIDPSTIIPPQTYRPLIIETAGGIYVPLTTKALSFDVLRKWNCGWVVVSRHYIGSINHTLLTVEALKKNHIAVSGVIFNGEPNPDSEAAILEMSQIPFLGRLYPEKSINSQIIKRYAKQWKSRLLQLIK